MRYPPLDQRSPESGFPAPTRPEVRVAGFCGGGATSKLRLRSGGEGIEVRFEVDHSRAGEVWRVVLVHERRIGWKGSVKTSRSGGSFEVERTLRDLPGADEVIVRADGPRGLVCRADATLPDACVEGLLRVIAERERRDSIPDFKHHRIEIR